jgi:FkbM family methyltransferase
MRNRLVRWLASRVPTGVHLPILRGPLRGRWWVAGAGAGEGKGLSTLVNGCEPREIEMLDALVPRGSVAFDVGACVGLYSLLLSRRCSRVFAFEPLPRNIRYLERTLAANRVNNVTVVPWAVSDAHTLAQLNEGENCALSSLGPEGRQPAVTVSCDQFVERYGAVPRVLKVDVEGAEAAVLRGARRLLARVKPLVLVSTHSPRLDVECISLMRQAGYPQPRRLALDGLNGGSSLLWLPPAPVERGSVGRHQAPGAY